MLTYSWIVFLEQGNSEFIHFDVNPFQRVHESEAQIYGTATQGKVMYTDSKFVAVPGTHTAAFYRALLDEYGPLYPSFTKKSSADVKLAVSRDKDPWNLWSMARTFKVPAGCMVVWSDRVLHGHSQTPIDKGAEYGMYLGFFGAGSRAEYVQRSQRIMKGIAFTDEEARLRQLSPYGLSGITELQDRLRSFECGDAPLMWPSFDPICYFPKKFLNFPKVLKANRLDKLDPAKTPTCPATGLCMLTTRVTGKVRTVSLNATLMHVYPFMLGANRASLLRMTTACAGRDCSPSAACAHDRVCKACADGAGAEAAGPGQLVRLRRSGLIGRRVWRQQGLP